MSYCQCDWGEGGDDCEVFIEKIVIARKTHVCCECDEPILPGERYEFVKGLWNGTWDTYRTCSTCAKIRKDTSSSWIYGQLDEALHECFDLEIGDGVKTRRSKYRSDSSY